MIFSEKYFEEIKTYFGEQGKAYNAILLEYIHLVKELKNEAIRSEKTAKKLEVFLEYTKNLEDVTEDIAGYTNCTIEDFVAKVNSTDRYMYSKPVTIGSTERDFTDGYEQAVMDELKNKLANWNELELQATNISHWGTTLGLNGMIQNAQEFQGSIVREITQGINGFLSVVNTVSFYDDLYVKDNMYDIQEAMKQFITYLNELGNVIDPGKVAIDIIPIDKLQSTWNEYFSYYNITRKKLIYDEGGNRFKIQEVSSYQKNCIIDDFERNYPEYKNAMDTMLSTGDPNKLEKEDMLNIKYIAYTAPEPYRTIYLANLNLCVFYCIYDEKVQENVKNGYSSEERKIVIRNMSQAFMNNPRTPYMTIFHESGHAIDHMISGVDGAYFTENYITSSSELDAVKKSIGKEEVTLQDAIYYDVYNSIEKQIKHGKALDDEKTNGEILDEESIERILDSFQGDTEETIMLTSEESTVKNEVLKYYSNEFKKNENVLALDIYRSMTNGVIDVLDSESDDTQAKIGHEEEYWSNEDGSSNNNQSKELWAEYFASCMTDNKTSLRSIEKYFPESSKVLEEIVTQLEEETNA